MSAQDFRVKNGLVVGTTTSSGNTTITGFANATGSVNSALLTVGTSFIANTLGVTSTGYANVTGNIYSNTYFANSKINVGSAAGFDFGTSALVELDGSGNTFVQIVIQNANTQLNASSDLVVTSDTGNNTQDYVDLGINSSTYSNALYTISGSNDGYLYASNGALAIGTAAAKAVLFHANGTLSTDEKMRISANGNVGIGNTAPIDKLSVGGTVAAGNTTITGFANIISDTASIQVGNTTAYFIGNTTGLNPASNTLGSALGNTTARWVITGAAGTFTGLTTSGTLSHTGPTGNYGSSTAAATYQLGYGATTTGVLKTINIGIAGAAGSTTNVNIGSTLSNTFVTINANTVAFTGALSGITTLAAGNTTVTGFANVAGTVSMYSYKEQTNTAVISTGTLTINAAAATTFDVSLNAAITTFTFQNFAASGLVSTFTIVFTADGTARAITWPSSVKWPSNTAPTLTSTLNKKDIFTFFTEDAGTTILAFASGQNCG